MNKRLKEERVRLKLSQGDICELCDVSKQTPYRWESGTPIPSDKLAILADHGFDAQYIITGVRSLNCPSVKEIEDQSVLRNDLAEALELIQQQSAKGLSIIKKLG